MPSDSIFASIASPLILVLGAVVAAVYFYGAVWAFRIRRALMSPLFKDRALWVGYVAAAFVVLVSSNLIIRFLAPDDFYLGLVEYVIVDTAGIVTLAWTDTTIKIARRSDPLNRNTFKWKQLRIVLWGLTFLTTAGSLVSVVILRINYFTSPGGAGGAFVAGSFGWVLFGFLALYLSYKRSGDPILRDHLKWFGLFLFLLFIVNSVLSNDYEPLRIAGEVLLAVDAYFLYRGARSLAPMSRVPLDLRIRQVTESVPSS